MSLAETFRQGKGPASWDGVAEARGEDFELEDILTRVVIWHGEQDRNDPDRNDPALPRVTAHYYPGRGHLIFFSRIEEILAELVAA